jgi:hypothetical protein
MASRVTTNRFVGSTAARVSAPLFAAAAMAMASVPPGVVPFKTLAVVILAVLAWLGVVHASAGLFALWMRFADLLHTVAVTVLFGACYLVVVPLFRLALWFRDPLSVRRARQTSWVPRTRLVDADSLERMG